MFLYTRCQNLNRGGNASSDSDLEQKKKRTSKVLMKHSYPEIPENADDEESKERNLTRLKQEMKKQKLSFEIVKELMARTFSTRRTWILNTESLSVKGILDEYPVLKKTRVVH